MAKQDQSDHDLKQVTLQDGAMRLRLLNYGATTCDWRVRHRGHDLPLVLGYADPRAYLTSPYYMGAIAGRVANRIAGAQFTLNGETHHLVANEGVNQLHGGPTGLGKQFWHIETDGGRAARLTCHSPAGDNGFPGRAVVTLEVRLQDNRVIYDLLAQVDCPTPISLAQHNYYNLMGSGTIWDHQFRCAASHVLEKDATGVSTGRILPVAGGALDFTQARRFGDADPQHRGADHNLVFDPDRDPTLPVAEITAPNGLQLRVFSDQPGAQIYTAMGLPPHAGGLDGLDHGPARGFCLEPQGFPNAVNIPVFPSVIVTPDQPYRQRLELALSGIAP